MKNENERFVEMGKRIKARRVSLGMKQMELAERIDISNNHTGRQTGRSGANESADFVVDKAK